MPEALQPLAESWQVLAAVARKGAATKMFVEGDTHAFAAQVIGDGDQCNLRVLVAIVHLH